MTGMLSPVTVALRCAKQKVVQAVHLGEVADQEAVVAAEVAADQMDLQVQAKEVPVQLMERPVAYLMPLDQVRLASEDQRVQKEAPDQEGISVVLDGGWELLLIGVSHQ